MTSRPQVRLLAATVPLLNALNEDRSLFAELVGSPVPNGWPEFPEAIGFTLEHLRAASDADRSWSMQFFVDPANGRLLGSGGFAAPPVARTVEIGYEVASEFRGRGIGVAAARALVERAVASGEVDHVIAHTLPGPNPSTVFWCRWASSTSMTRKTRRSARSGSGDGLGCRNRRPHDLRHTAASLAIQAGGPSCLRSERSDRLLYSDARRLVVTV
jgi:RimJ/RimL family protein N-acetyltransferase